MLISRWTVAPPADQDRQCRRDAAGSPVAAGTSELMSASPGAGSRSEPSSALTIRLGVIGVAAFDQAVLDVVLDLVVAGELPASVAERQQERGDAERDHDRGQCQRLRQRVGVVTERTRRSDDRGLAAGAARRDEQQVGAVTEQADADDDARQAALHQQPGAASEQHRRDGGDQDGHGAALMIRPWPRWDGWRSRRVPCRRRTPRRPSARDRPRPGRRRCRTATPR